MEFQSLYNFNTNSKHLLLEQVNKFFINRYF